MRLTKAQRQVVYRRFAGRCAYCGCDLPERWHADHFEAVERKLVYVRDKGLVPNGELHRPENDRLDNMMPACPPCNISKGPLKLEAWREWLTNHLRSLNRHNTPYRLVKAYGLVQETGKPVQFYFEKLEKGAVKKPARAKTPYASYILAIVRAARPRSRPAVLHHVNRLIEELRKDGNKDLADALQHTLEPPEGPVVRVIHAATQKASGAIKHAPACAFADLPEDAQRVANCNCPAVRGVSAP